MHLKWSKLALKNVLIIKVIQKYLFKIKKKNKIIKITFYNCLISESHLVLEKLEIKIFVLFYRKKMTKLKYLAEKFRVRNNAYTYINK